MMYLVTMDTWEYYVTKEGDEDCTKILGEMIASICDEIIYDDRYE